MFCAGDLAKVKAHHPIFTGATMSACVAGALVKDRVVVLVARQPPSHVYAHWRVVFDGLTCCVYELALEEL